MTVSHSSRLRIIDTWDHDDVVDLTTVRDSMKETFYDVSLTDGSGNNQAQDMFHDQRTVGTGADDDIDLNAVIADVFGKTLAGVTLKELMIENTATASGEDLAVGGPAITSGAALITDLFDAEKETRIKVKAGGVLCIMAPLVGYTISAGTADIIRIHNNGSGSVIYNIVIKMTR